MPIEQRPDQHQLDPLLPDAHAPIGLPPSPPESLQPSQVHDQVLGEQRGNLAVLHFDMPPLEKRTKKDWHRLRQAYGQRFSETTNWNEVEIAQHVEGIEIQQLIDDLERMRQDPHSSKKKLRELAEEIERRRRILGLSPQNIDDMY